MGQPLPPETNPELEEQFTTITDMMERLAQHLNQHNQPAFMVEEMALQDANDLINPEPPAPPMGAGGGMPPGMPPGMGGGMPPGVPMPPGMGPQMMPQPGTGQVNMPQGVSMQNIMPGFGG